jgi:uncharacterized protein YndB with AHSA1/START domain
MTPETVPTAATVKRTLHVKAPIEHAFRMLTQKMGTWWPPSHHIGKALFAEIVIEPHAGGRWFERDANGVECDWGRVLVWEPPKHVAVSWHLQPDWSFHHDLSRASEVSFEFIPEGPEVTRVEFEHRHIQRHGEGWEKLRASVDSTAGWTGVLAEYEAALGGKRKTCAISTAERELALAELNGAQEQFLEIVKGLSPEQWKFKPSLECWSIAECAEHIAIVEDRARYAITEKALKLPAEPEKRRSIKFSDPAVLRGGIQRETKLRAPEHIQPSGRWTTGEEIIQNVSESRARTLEFVKTTQDDLRNHFLDHPAFGTLDTYQWVLLIAAHMQRHTAQIREVKSQPDFPMI